MIWLIKTANHKIYFTFYYVKSGLIWCVHLWYSEMDHAVRDIIRVFYHLTLYVYRSEISLKFLREDNDDILHFIFFFQLPKLVDLKNLI